MKSLKYLIFESASDIAVIKKWIKKNIRIGGTDKNISISSKPNKDGLYVVNVKNGVVFNDNATELTNGMFIWGKVAGGFDFSNCENISSLEGFPSKIEEFLSLPKRTKYAEKLYNDVIKYFPVTDFSKIEELDIQGLWNITGKDLPVLIGKAKLDTLYINYNIIKDLSSNKDSLKLINNNKINWIVLNAYTNYTPVEYTYPTYYNGAEGFKNELDKVISACPKFKDVIDYNKYSNLRSDVFREK